MLKQWFVHLMLLAALTLVAGCGGASAPVVSADPLPERAVEETAANTSAPDTAPAESSFAFPADGVGKQLEHRLTPPRQVPLPHVPFVSEPVSRKPTRLDRAFEPVPPLADLTGPAHLLPSEKQRTVKDRTPLDSPPLAADLTPTLPHPIWFMTTPRAWAGSPDPLFLQPKGASGNELPVITSDPTLDASRQVVITAPAPWREQPAPPVNLTTPDPFEALRAFRLRTPPSEFDEPASPTQRPPVPAFPVK